MSMRRHRHFQGLAGRRRFPEAPGARFANTARPCGADRLAPARVVFEATGAYHRAGRGAGSGLLYCKVNPRQARRFSQARGAPRPTGSTRHAGGGQVLELEPRPRGETIRSNALSSAARPGQGPPRPRSGTAPCARAPPDRAAQAVEATSPSSTPRWRPRAATDAGRRSWSRSPAGRPPPPRSWPEDARARRRWSAGRRRRWPGSRPSPAAPVSGAAAPSSAAAARALRRARYMPALVAARHNPDLRAAYERLVAAGEPKKLALVAVMRKLLVLAETPCSETAMPMPLQDGY